MSADLVQRWRDGDERAAAELVRLYTYRLLALARSRLPANLARRADPEDVVQSAFRSFFRIVATDAVAVQPGDDLWQLLAAITLRKVHRQVARHWSAEKRSVGRENYWTDAGSLFGMEPQLLSREPSPEEQAEVVDELQEAMREMNPLHRRMVELSLQGHPTGEVATATSRSDRMVRLILEQFRKNLEQRLCDLARA
jgi:RNA polymerase sigma-70 factor (ECF subfamily)